MKESKKVILGVMKKHLEHGDRLKVRSSTSLSARWKVPDISFADSIVDGIYRDLKTDRP